MIILHSRENISLSGHHEDSFSGALNVVDVAANQDIFKALNFRVDADKI